MRRALLLVAVVATAIVLNSCAGAGGHETGVVQQVREHEQHNDNGGARIDAAFDNEVLVPAEVKGLQFSIRSRQAALEKFPCVRCHKVPLAQMKHDGKDGQKKAHWNVKMKHADEGSMTCSTCHMEGDLNQLRLLGNKPVALDASYKVCAQCHSKQASDWAGGAHGKRVGGWAPPRVSKTCAECHNPHSPAFDPRFPAMVTRREDKPGHE